MRVRGGLFFGRSRRSGQRELCPVEKNASLVEKLLQQLAGTFGIELRNVPFGDRVRTTVGQESKQVGFQLGIGSARVE